MLTHCGSKAKASRLVKVGAALLLATALAGCANNRLTTGSISRGGEAPAAKATMSAGELSQATEALGQRYIRDPKDRDTALRYAEALQMTGRADQSLAVMRKAAIDHPSDRSVLAAYGKALAAVGELQPALDAVRRAQTPEFPDWKLMSAEGAILDQLGQTAEARALYRKAIDLAPNEPSIYSNLGMSHLLEGDLAGAERNMRQATQMPGADSRVRQNLALVVGLQGRFEEAEQIAASELSPDQAQANVAYLRSMLAQQNAWQQLDNKAQ